MSGAASQRWSSAASAPGFAVWSARTVNDTAARAANASPGNLMLWTHQGPRLSDTLLWVPLRNGASPETEPASGSGEHGAPKAFCSAVDALCAALPTHFFTQIGSFGDSRSRTQRKEKVTRLMISLGFSCSCVSTTERECKNNRERM